jgi:hypothetical protein
MSPIEGIRPATPEEIEAAERKARINSGRRGRTKGVTGLPRAIGDMVAEEGSRTVEFSEGSGRLSAWQEAILLLARTRRYLRRTKGVEVETAWERDKRGGRLVIVKKD